MSQQSIRIAQGAERWLNQLGLGNVKAVLKYPAPPAVALSKSSETFPIALDPSLGGPSFVYVKRYRYKTIGKQLRQLGHGSIFGRSRSQYEYEFLDTMQRKNLPGVRPVAYGTLKRMGLLRACFLIVEGETNAQSLDQIAHGADRMSVADRIRFTIGLAEMISRLHEAGVMHGALAWRNIIVQFSPDSEPVFHFIDPSRKGLIGDRALDPMQVEKDLSHFMASGIAVGVRGGVSRFMKAYWGTHRLNDIQRAMIRRLIKRAEPMVPAEQHRVAVSDAWSQVRKRFEQPSPEAGRSAIDCADDFFETFSSRAVDAKAFGPGVHVIQIEIAENGTASTKRQRTLVVKDQKIHLENGGHVAPHMTIQTDEETWLAVVNGRAEAMSLIQGGRLRLMGDRSLAASLIKTLESSNVETQ